MICDKCRTNVPADELNEYNICKECIGGINSIDENSLNSNSESQNLVPDEQASHEKRYCPNCNSLVSIDDEDCPFCGERILIERVGSITASFISYLWGGLAGGIALGGIRILEAIGLFDGNLNRLLEMIIFGVIAISVYNAKKAQLMAKQDLSVKLSPGTGSAVDSDDNKKKRGKRVMPLNTKLWECPNCKQKLEPQFSQCWNCGASRAS